MTETGFQGKSHNPNFGAVLQRVAQAVYPGCSASLQTACAYLFYKLVQTGSGECASLNLVYTLQEVFHSVLFHCRGRCKAGTTCLPALVNG